MVFTEDLADDTRRLLDTGIVCKAEAVHSVENAAVDGFHSVTHVWKGAGYDDRHRIVDVCGLHLAFYVNRYDFADRGDIRLIYRSIHHGLPGKVFLFVHLQ